MSMTDPISDFLARIRNGSLARKDRIEMPHSFLKKNIAEVLKAEGYVDDVRDGPRAELRHGVVRFVQKRAGELDDATRRGRGQVG